ncbi:bifunctional DNA primase/polymerase [Longimycelium tulufanense]|nr:bifunctional DNA primase/polymerase [Longimycelium tulufanense]
MVSTLEQERATLDTRAWAAKYAEHGWRVVPETSSLVPTPRSSVGRWVVNGAGDSEIGKAPAIFLACGYGIDAVEISAGEGQLVLSRLALSGVSIPAAATPLGRYLLFVRSTGSMHPALNVGVHGAGEQVPLPPSPHLCGRYRWVVGPVDAGWRVPELDILQDALFVVFRSLSKGF